MLTADLNGNGRDEVLIAFAGYGLWAYRDGATWSQIHGTMPVRVVEGHLDTGNREDPVIDFGAGLGVWTYRNDLHVDTAAPVNRPSHCDRRPQRLAVGRDHP
jgi:hypothetical protein